MAKIRSTIWTEVIWIGIVIAAAIIIGISVQLGIFDRTLPPEYSYDIEKYARIDPALILYQQAGESIPLDFKVTRAIALGPAGNIYVAGDEKVVIMDAAGSLLNEIEFQAEPTCIEIEKDGTMLVGLTDHIVFVNPAGKVVAQWQSSAENALLTSLAVDKHHVFVADAVNKVVLRYNRQGNLLKRIGKKDEHRNIPGIVVPSPYFDIAMADDGLLRVVNPGRHWIEAYTVDGDREWAWGKAAVSIEGFSGCCNPVSFAILPDDGFVTAEKGLVRVKVYDADGEFVGVVAGPDQLGWLDPLRICQTPEQCSVKGFDLAVDPKGRIYVLDMVRNNIRLFEKK